MQTATIFAPPSYIPACPTKHTCPKQNLRNRWVTHICTLAVEKHTSDVPACQRNSQRTCWPQPVVSWDSRNAATQSVRTSTACRLHWSGTLTCMLTTADKFWHTGTLTFTTHLFRNTGTLDCSTGTLVLARVFQTKCARSGLKLTTHTFSA